MTQTSIRAALFATLITLTFSTQCLSARRMHSRRQHTTQKSSSKKTRGLYQRRKEIEASDSKIENHETKKGLNGWAIAGIVGVSLLGAAALGGSIYILWALSQFRGG